MVLTSPACLRARVVLNPPQLKTSAQEAAAPYDEGEETADEAEAEPVNPKSVLYSRTESSSNDGLHSQALEPEVSEAVHLKVLESARADVRRAQVRAPPSPTPTPL